MATRALFEREIEVKKYHCSECFDTGAIEIFGATPPGLKSINFEQWIASIMSCPLCEKGAELKPLFEQERIIFGLNYAAAATA